MRLIVIQWRKNQERLIWQVFYVEALGCVMHQIAIIIFMR